MTLVDTATDAAVEGTEVSGTSLPNRRGVLLRLLLLASIIGILIAVGFQSGLTADLTKEAVRARIDAAGALGPLVFIVIFTGGQMVHVPGVVFVSAGSIAWGVGEGAMWSLLASTIAVSVNILFVRTIGGQPVGRIKNESVRKVLSHLHTRPILVVFLLRLTFMTSPALTTLFALSPLRMRDHFIGSAFGMAPQALLISWIVDTLIRSA